MGKGCLLSVVLVLGCMCAAMSSGGESCSPHVLRFCVGQRYADEGNTLSITSSTKTLLGVAMSCGGGFSLLMVLTILFVTVSGR